MQPKHIPFGDDMKTKIRSFVLVVAVEIRFILPMLLISSFLIGAAAFASMGIADRLFDLSSMFKSAPGSIDVFLSTAHWLLLSSLISFLLACALMAHRSGVASCPRSR
jgi:hypothetical protein